MEFVFKQSNAADTEYLGSYVTRIRHYDAWNEYIHRTCTRTVGSGKNQRTETYDCSYVENHPELHAETENSEIFSSTFEKNENFGENGRNNDSETAILQKRNTENQIVKENSKIQKNSDKKSLQKN